MIKSWRLWKESLNFKKTKFSRIVDLIEEIISGNDFKKSGENPPLRWEWSEIIDGESFDIVLELGQDSVIFPFKIELWSQSHLIKRIETWYPQSRGLEESDITITGFNPYWIRGYINDMRETAHQWLENREFFIDFTREWILDITSDLIDLSREWSITKREIENPFWLINLDIGSIDIKSVISEIISIREIIKPYGLGVSYTTPDRTKDRSKIWLKIYPE
jgi:hypothetical protein